MASLCWSTYHDPRFIYATQTPPLSSAPDSDSPAHSHTHSTIIHACFQHINVVYRLSIAFVRYRLRASAEFAKLAMQNQVKSDEGSDKARLLVISPPLDSPSPGAGQQGMFESALGLR